MTHRSNGKHRFPVSESTSRLPPHVGSAGEADSQWLTRIEHEISEAHDKIVSRATEFIRQRPGASLAIAAAIGGMIGWMIKRRS